MWSQSVKLLMKYCHETCSQYRPPGATIRPRGGQALCNSCVSSICTSSIVPNMKTIRQVVHNISPSNILPATAPGGKNCNWRLSNCMHQMHNDNLSSYSWDIAFKAFIGVGPHVATTVKAIKFHAWASFNHCVASYPLWRQSIKLCMGYCLKRLFGVGPRSASSHNCNYTVIKIYKRRRIILFKQNQIWRKSVVICRL